MADSSAPRGLLDRARTLFSLAGELGRWLKEQNQPQYSAVSRETVQETIRQLRQRFGKLVQVVLDNAPAFIADDSCPDVAAVVRALAEWTAQWDALTDNAPTGQEWTSLVDEWPALNTFALNGSNAIEREQDESKQRKWDFLNGAGDEPRKASRADDRPLPRRIWTVEDYYRVKDFYDSRGLYFNPALEAGSPAGYHVLVQAQMEQRNAKEISARSPAAAVSFLERVRDEVHGAADAKRQQKCERISKCYPDEHGWRNQVGGSAGAGWCPQRSAGRNHGEGRTCPAAGTDHRNSRTD